MAVPFRRTSKTAKRKRRTHFKLSVPGMVVCPNCGEMKLSHRVCKECGQYNGKVVLEEKTEVEE
jgi:large subunit ribosomal protein L32